jgi:hypothetical protein
MRQPLTVLLVLLAVSFLAGGWVLAQEGEPADETTTTETDPAEGEDPDTDGTEPVLYGAVKGLTTALNASENRSDNATEVLTRNLERAMERQGIDSGDPMDPDETTGDNGDTVEAEGAEFLDAGSDKASAVKLDAVSDRGKPVKQERVEKLEPVTRPDKPERPERPEKPEKPERPARPDRP